jgi:hypothetical protein
MIAAERLMAKMGCKEDHKHGEAGKVQGITTPWSVS